MKCPCCETPLSLNTVAMDKELVSLHLEWEGAMVEARTIGGVVENTRKLLAASAKEVGIPSDIFMRSIEWGDKQATFHFLVIPRTATPASGGPRE